MATLSKKHTGAYFTPDEVAETLVRWAVRNLDDRMLDPSCGDGQFIARHQNSVGIELDPGSAGDAIARAPWALVHEGDFFTWAEATHERFNCLAGNPPFIRYQTFSGSVRERALRLCRTVGAEFSGLTSAWAPFLVAATTLLQPGGRLAFVVPAEIGHAPYAVPLLDHLVASFNVVHVVAIQAKLFPALSEDCWLLYADGYGGGTNEIRFSATSSFAPSARPPTNYSVVPVGEWRGVWRSRLRPYLLDSQAREHYQAIATARGAKRFGAVASIGIGYVTGANDFFHLSPSDAAKFGIPNRFLIPTVRKGRSLPRTAVSEALVEQWRANDEPAFLLRIQKDDKLPPAVKRYLASPEAEEAKRAYKCRARSPWYCVPDVRIPDFFLSYMSGRSPVLARNLANCTCTNSVHGVQLKDGALADWVETAWQSPFTALSCELEGHPLGGGMLKLEPTEATRIVLPRPQHLKLIEPDIVSAAVQTMQAWRHHG